MKKNENKKRQKDTQNIKIFNQEYEHKSLGFQDVMIKSIMLFIHQLNINLIITFMYH